MMKLFKIFKMFLIAQLIMNVVAYLMKQMMIAIMNKENSQPTAKELKNIKRESIEKPQKFK